MYGKKILRSAYNGIVWFFRRPVNSSAKCKLGVTYSVFSGEEVLKFSVASIRNQVDYINVVFQKTSWWGEPCNPELEEYLRSLTVSRGGMIDKIIEYNYEFDPLRDRSITWKYDVEKRNVGVQDLKDNGCTHCMIMDNDELYFEDEFREAKDYVINNGITHSACPIYDYMHEPEIRTRDADKYSVPFIFKLYKHSVVIPGHHMPCYLDPIRSFRYSRFLDRFYYFNSVCMHHMTGIRSDFHKKARATIALRAEPNTKYIAEMVKTFDAEESMS